MNKFPKHYYWEKYYRQDQNATRGRSGMQFLLRSYWIIIAWINSSLILALTETGFDIIYILEIRRCLSFQALIAIVARGGCFATLARAIEKGVINHWVSCQFWNEHLVQGVLSLDKTTTKIKTIFRDKFSTRQRNRLPLPKKKKKKKEIQNDIIQCGNIILFLSCLNCYRNGQLEIKRVFTYYIQNAKKVAYLYVLG